MKLYYSPGACSLAPHIVLREAGLAFDLVLAPTKTHLLPDGSDFRLVNPLGYVPFLELDDGSHLREGQVIVQYLGDLAPAKNLLPAHGGMARYRLQEWLAFIATELHKGFGPLFNPATPEAYKTMTKARLQERLEWLNSQLAAQDYTMGAQFCVADAYLFTVLGWAGRVGVDLSAFGHVTAFHARVGARPAVQAALRAEGLLA